MDAGTYPGFVEPILELGTIVGDYEIVPVPSQIRRVDRHQWVPDDTYSQHVLQWMTKHVQTGVELTITKHRFDGVPYQEPIRGAHHDSVAQMAKDALGIREATMQYDVTITNIGGTSVIGGPYDEVDAAYHRKRLAEQHPESVFEVREHPEPVKPAT